MKKELYEYKLDLFYYGVNLTDSAYKNLKKGKNNQVNHDDYITTKGLLLCLENKVYVNANLNKNSRYKIDYIDKKFILSESSEICQVHIFQPPNFALQTTKLPNGLPITNFVNIHGDRIRIQPIGGCANRCKFCDLNQIKYQLHSISDLEQAFLYALENHGFKHILISGGSPRNNNSDFQYLTEVYQYFGSKYGKRFPIDVMLVPRGLEPGKDSKQDYYNFLTKLKSWNITGIYANLELYNDSLRKKYIPQKDDIGKEKYYEFLKIATEVFGKENVKSCIIIGLEEVEDSLKAVEELCSLGCMPVLSPYVPIDNKIPSPTPEMMKKVLIQAQKIADKYKVALGPSCNLCKHNTIHFN